MDIFSYFTTSDKISFEDDEFEDAGEGTALALIADAFEEIADSIKKGNKKDVLFELDLKPFCEACSLVSILFGSLGIAFKFAEMEYTSKVNDLADAASVYGTLSKVIDYDVKADTVQAAESLTRKLRRVRQGLDLIRELFQNFLSTDDYSLKEAASSAYKQVCAPYHTWAVRTAVSAGMCALPTRDQLLLNLNETDESAENEMRRYIKASLPVIKYIDNLFTARGITLDW
ncbi:putative glycolipid transfer protein [Helianthus annuus]|uniref:Glycolipid transfer protein n=1 Tax=Helianthus annuus TaxID=4232 RepID=A0A251VJ69_HELAN|nr:ACD11 homolog protein [Helianthus annuus]KAF5794120.1 putative glycolipid transfer protein [Helianthus annuus]KAJ0537835.1 putative glycolipid transfer protein [Helianthus annuus]KAJ0552422.1 putative glycolipid transfer protein [Helianthus annuus]KAJ0721357.1 putative glycolipid transfer protein [Helianthus annuus]KAJ0896546.1 putative glycolipid transfer protein [Helianthus annuus]